ncbi:MAG: 16S rRNA (cytidine(1402)-2'-O)-methyltransferase [Alicyclobacillus sp.]|nr:16S rRNA (cytidine(1402)-2'-O)-methyltransferase [Alicyclobacillus sp.]
MVGSELARLGARLFVCGTPIGNLADASFRLLDTLRQADVVAAEDTRHTRKLLAYYDIHPPLLVSYHEHNWRSRAGDLLRWWQEGKTVALVSDAGTPGISDPGAEAVALAVDHGVPVIPVPGPSALVTALSGCGFPAQPVVFLGFMPRSERAARAVLEPFMHVPGVLVLYEAPHRLRATLRWLAALWPQRPAVLGKELTKRHEAFLRGTLTELAAKIDEEEPRGEYVLILGPLPRGAAVTVALDGIGEVCQNEDEADRVHAETEEVQRAAVAQVRAAIAAGQSHAAAVREVARRTGVRRKWLYQETLMEERSGPANPGDSRPSFPAGEPGE